MMAGDVDIPSQADQLRELLRDRDAWIRRFNRLEAAVSHHKAGKSAMFVDEVDEALYAARDKVLRDASRVGSPALDPIEPNVQLDGGAS